MRKKRVLFICTGNTCRSPLAEVFLNHLAGDRFEARSAGVFAENGAPLSSGSARVLEQEGLSATHASQQVSDELMEWADVVIAMSNSHKFNLQSRYNKADILTLKEIAGMGTGDVADPFGGSDDVYRLTAKEIKEALTRLINQNET